METTTGEARADVKRRGSWRDELAAEHEFAQARLRYMVEQFDDVEEFI